MSGAHDIVLFPADLPLRAWGAPVAGDPARAPQPAPRAGDRPPSEDGTLAPPLGLSRWLRFEVDSVDMRSISERYERAVLSEGSVVRALFFGYIVINAIVGLLIVQPRILLGIPIAAGCAGIAIVLLRPAWAPTIATVAAVLLLVTLDVQQTTEVASCTNGAADMVTVLGYLPIMQARAPLPPAPLPPSRAGWAHERARLPRRRRSFSRGGS